MDNNQLLAWAQETFALSEGDIEKQIKIAQVMATAHITQALEQLTAEAYSDAQGR